MIYDDKTYNCLHYAVDKYQAITGVDIGLYVAELMTGKDNRKINPAKLSQFTPLDAPASPCFAVMRGATVHAGVYHDGLIHHLTESGEQAVPPHIAQLQHGLIKYYAFYPTTYHQ